MIRNKFEDAYSPKAEINTMVSETVPHQALSPREILDRFAKGTLPQSMAHEKEYSEDMPDIRFMDISEQVRIYNENKDWIKATEKHLRDEKKKSMEQAKDKEENSSSASASES